MFLHLYCVVSWLACCSSMLFIYGLENFYPRRYHRTCRSLCHLSNAMSSSHVGSIITEFQSVVSSCLLLTYMLLSHNDFYYLYDVSNKDKIILWKLVWFLKLRLWRERSLTVKETLIDKFDENKIESVFRDSIYNSTPISNICSLTD